MTCNFKEKTIKVIHLDHGFVWCRNLDSLEDYHEAFHSVHFHVAVISLIFHLNAYMQLNIYCLLNVSYMFQCSLHHPPITSHNHLLL
jgi:hypothetical protein